jgi:hypothetical protein
MAELVPETAIDYGEVIRRGGTNCGDEDFALFKCPGCGHVYLMDYEVDTVYLDAGELSKRVSVFAESFPCVECGNMLPKDGPWVGPRARQEFGVTWTELVSSDWAWVVRQQH